MRVHWNAVSFPSEEDVEIHKINAWWLGSRRVRGIRGEWKGNEVGEGEEMDGGRGEGGRDSGRRRNNRCMN